MFDIKQIQKMQSQMQERLTKAQEELKTKSVVGTSGGGAMTVTCDGNQMVLSVKIKPGIVELGEEDLDMLQDLMVAAANQAIEAAKKLSEDSLGSVTGGLKIPGLTL
jgi:nucleoid-associated protein EbfC